MHRYIGLDVHDESTTMVVVGPSGRRLRTQVLATEARELVEAVRAVGGQRHVCLEEGAQSEWLYEVLQAHAEDVVVAVNDKGRNAAKSDERDAAELAQKLREQGRRPNLAKLTIARRIAAIVLAMWKRRRPKTRRS